MILTLFCNEVDVTNRIKSISKHAEFSEKTLIGNTPSSEYKIKLMNQDGYFDEEMLKYPFLVYLDGELHDTLFVYDSPEELFTDIDLTLYDSMIFTNIEYTTNTSTYPKTIKDQLDEMVEITGISIDYSLLDESVLNLEVNSYDTSIMIRSYLSWISEIGACNVLSQPNNTLKFIPLEVNAKHSIENDSHVYNFKTSNKFNFSKVYFDNGLKVVSSGDDTGNVVYLSEDNPYISDSKDDTDISQAILDNIHTKLLGLNFTSVSGLKMRSIDSLKLGEIVHYKDYFDVIALSYDIDFINGPLAHNIITIDGIVNNVSKEKAIHVAKSTEKKLLEVKFNNFEQRLTIVSTTSEKNKSDIAKLILDNEKISLSVSSTEKKVETLEKQVTVTNVSSQWGKSTSKTVAPTSWLDTKPTLEIGEYMWMREKYTYSDSTVKYDGVRMISAEDGKDACITSNTAPTDTSQMWLDTSIEPNVLKYYDNTTSAWIRANDQTGKIEESKSEITTEYSAAIQAMADTINLSISKLTNKVGVNENTIVEINNKIQVNESTISNIIETTTKIESFLDGKVDTETIKKYMEFDGDDLIIKATNSTFYSKFSKTELAFYEGEKKLAWFSNDEMHVLTAVITKAIGCGDFLFEDTGDLLVLRSLYAS